jgi:cardiolipin synthase
VNLPNLITFGRLFAVPVMVWLLLRGQYPAAFWLFVAAGISDAVDGFIAKRFRAVTVLGSYLDPLADKALLVSVYVTLGEQGHMPVWLVILVVFRDVLIVGGAILFETLTHALTMEPLLISKINTAAQIVLAAVVLAGLGLDLQPNAVSDVLMGLVALTTVLSGGAYVVTWTRRAAEYLENGR